MIDQAAIFAVAAVVVFCMALYGLIAYAHLIRKIMAINIMGSAIFLFFGAVARRNQVEAGGDVTDPVPQAMVITGIVVAVAATAFAIALARRIHALTGEAQLPEERESR